MIKGSVQQEDITTIKIYAPNTGAPTYMKQILTELKGKIECNAFILETSTHHSFQKTDQPDRK